LKKENVSNRKKDGELKKKKKKTGLKKKTGEGEEQ
jgi:hypothetical protein